MEFENDVVVPDHSHESQWGVVLSGEIELTVEGRKNTLKKGDTYFILKTAVTLSKGRAKTVLRLIFSQRGNGMHAG